MRSRRRMSGSGHNSFPQCYLISPLPYQGFHTHHSLSWPDIPGKLRWGVRWRMVVSFGLPTKQQLMGFIYPSTRGVNGITQKGTRRAFPVYFALASQPFLSPPHIPCNSSQSLQYPFNRQVFIKWPFVLVLGKQRGLDTETPLNVYGAGGSRGFSGCTLPMFFQLLQNITPAEPSLMCPNMGSPSVCVLSVLAQPSKVREETSLGFPLVSEWEVFRRSQALSCCKGESEDIGEEQQARLADLEDWL